MVSPNEPIAINVDIPNNEDAQSSHSRSSTSNTPKAFSSKETRSLAVEWHDLEFEVEVSSGFCGKQKETKQIVKKCSGSFTPGTLTALMGPSGAGKTTLMNVLAGRASYGRITGGKVLLNGLEADPEAYKNQLAYVMQHDAMFATQTPREALHFTAALRLPEYSPEQREEIVESALNALCLQQCADTLIGSVMIPGLSGGEKKRTAVAMELISSPSLIFLDEPTSGLDSHNAFELVNILRSLAESGCTIVCTIHQPSSEVFDLFHRVVYLRKGYTVYAGSVEGSKAAFETEDIVCKNHTNPADFAMHRLQLMSEEEMMALVDAQPIIPEPKVKGTFSKSDFPQPSMASIFTQLRHLTNREFKQLIRDKATLVSRFGMAVMMALMLGCVYWEAADDWGTDFDASDISVAIQNHWGALTFIGINAMMLAAMPVVLTFPLQRAAFMREYTSGAYTSYAYLIAKTLLDVPAAVLQQVLATAVFYNMVGMNGNFAFIVFSISQLAVVSASIGIFVGSSTANAETAINIVPAIFIPQILFSGFFISSDKIPVYLQWAQWCCPLKYGINLVTISEFTPSAVPDNRQTEADDLIYRSDISRDSWWFYVAIMCGMFVFFRVASGCMLAFKARHYA